MAGLRVPLKRALPATFDGGTEIRRLINSGVFPGAGRPLEAVDQPVHVVRIGERQPAGALERGDLLGRQLPARGTEVVLELADVSGAQDRRRDAGLAEEPVESHLCRAPAQLGGQPCDCARHGEVAVAQAPLGLGLGGAEPRVGMQRAGNLIRVAPLAQLNKERELRLAQLKQDSRVLIL